MNTLPGENAESVTQLDELTDLATPFAVRVAATLRVADLIASGVDSLDGLAEACGSHRDALGRLLRFLVRRGVFTEPADGLFGLTDTGRLLCDDGPAGQRGRLDLTGVGAAMDTAVGGLLHSVRTGEPAYATVHGRTLWEDLDAHPGYRAYFDDLMQSQQKLTAPQVAQLYDWAGVDHVVDVGGGSGGLLVELLTTHPHLRATLVDRPAPVRTAERAFAEHGLTGRVRLVPGDFFTSVPAGGDLYVISRVLTDWNDESATAILRRTREAAGPDGRVLIVEVLPSQPYAPHETPYDLQMLAVVGGRARDVGDFAVLAGAAGLAVRRTWYGADGLVLIELGAEGEP